MFKALFDSAKSAVEVVSDVVESAQTTVTHPTTKNTQEDNVEDEVAKIDSQGGKVQLPSVRVESSSPEDYDFITKESVEDEIPLLHTPGYTSSFSAYSAEDTPKEESFVHVRTVEDTLTSVGNTLLDKARAGAIAVGEGMAQIAKETKELEGNIERREKIETNVEKKPVIEDISGKEGTWTAGEQLNELREAPQQLLEAPLTELGIPSTESSFKNLNALGVEESLDKTEIVSKDQDKADEAKEEYSVTERIIPVEYSVPNKDAPGTEEALDKTEAFFKDQDKADEPPVTEELTKKPEAFSSEEETLQMDKIIIESMENMDKTVEEIDYPIEKTDENYESEKEFSEGPENQKIDTSDIPFPTEEILDKHPGMEETEPVCVKQEQKDVNEAKYEATAPKSKEESRKDDDLNIGEKIWDAGANIVNTVLDKAQDVNEKIEDMLHDEPKEVGNATPEKEPYYQVDDEVPEVLEITKPIPYETEPEIVKEHQEEEQAKPKPATGTEIPVQLEIVTEVTEITAKAKTDPEATPSTDEAAAQTDKSAMIEIDPEGSWPNNCSNLVMDVVFEGAVHNKASAGTVCEEKQVLSE